MFRGRYQHTLDPKGRVSVPAKYRDLLAQYEGATLVVVPNGDALEVHPLEEWERLEERINEKSMFDADVRKVGRLYISGAHEVELDGAGRILIPPDVRAQGGLTKDVTLIGLGRKYFEIWDRARFDEYVRLNSDGLPSGFERLAQMGV
jgi:transcriptional regulator MraZ